MTKRSEAEINWDEYWDDYDSAAQKNPAQQMRHEFIANQLDANHLAAGAQPSTIDDRTAAELAKLVSAAAARPEEDRSSSSALRHPCRLVPT